MHNKSQVVEGTPDTEVSPYQMDSSTLPEMAPKAILLTSYLVAVGCKATISVFRPVLQTHIMMVSIKYEAKYS